jgi:hypothetical protein
MQNFQVGSAPFFFLLNFYTPCSYLKFKLGITKLFSLQVFISIFKLGFTGSVAQTRKFMCCNSRAS